MADWKIQFSFIRRKKAMKNKQIVSFVLAGMLTVFTLFGGITAQAAETNTMSETGTKACDIKATIGSEFSLTLPKTITLDSKTKK